MTTIRKQRRRLMLLLATALIMGTAFSRPAAEEKQQYGNTPGELEPFGRFVKEPYKRFFLTPQEFTGPGRDKPEPLVSTVKLGVVAPVERSHEVYMGSPMVEGIQLAVAQADKEGGYGGIPFEIVLRNDSGLWGASANEIVALSYGDSVWAVIGSIDGANTHIAIRVALKTEIAVMNVADTDPTLSETRIPWIFRNIADDRQMAYTLAYFLYRDQGYRKVAILRADNRYGRMGVGEFRSASVRLQHPTPMEINYETAYRKLNPDFAVQVDRLRRAQPDAVVLWADAEAGGDLVRRLREEGLKMPLFGCERLVNAEFLEAAGAAAEGLVAVYPYNPDADLPQLREFQDAYEARFGREPSVYAAHAYDGTNMVIQAIRQAGLNRYRIRDALAAIDQYDGVTGQIIMDAAFTDRGPVTMATVRDGRFVFNQPATSQRF